LEIRLPREEDRGRFVELFTSDEFMVFAGVLDEVGANARFDAMLVRAHEVSFAKQPVIERASGVIIGYTGVDRFVYDGGCVAGVRLPTRGNRSRQGLRHRGWPGAVGSCHADLP
jgi:hypothetical protein